MNRRFHASALLSTLLLPGCAQAFCEGHGYSLAISSLPADIITYEVHLEFERQTIDIECSTESVQPTACRASQGPWTVVVSFAQLQEYPAGLLIGNADDFSSRVPRGEIRVELTSPDRADFFAEHVVEARIEHQPGSPDCEFATDIWDLEGG